MITGIIQDMHVSINNKRKSTDNKIKQINVNSKDNKRQSLAYK